MWKTFIVFEFSAKESHSSNEAPPGRIPLSLYFQIFRDSFFALFVAFKLSKAAGRRGFSLYWKRTNKRIMHLPNVMRLGICGQPIQYCKVLNSVFYLYSYRLSALTTQPQIIYQQLLRCTRLTGIRDCCEKYWEKRNT